MSSFGKGFKIGTFFFFLLIGKSLFAISESDQTIKSFLLYSSCSFSDSKVVFLSDKSRFEFDQAFTLQQNRDLYVKFLVQKDLFFVRDKIVNDILIDGVQADFKIELLTLDVNNSVVSKDISLKLKKGENHTIPKDAVIYISYNYSYPYNQRMPVWRVQQMFPSELSVFAISYPELVELNVNLPKYFIPDVNINQKFKSNFVIDYTSQNINFTERKIQYSQLPSFSVEPFSTHYLDVIPSIFIKLISLKRNTKQKVPEAIRTDNGQNLFIELSGRSDFILKFKEKFELPKEYHNKILSIKDPQIKAARIFDLVRRHFYARKRDSVFLDKSIQSFQSLWSQRVATPTEINFVLVKILQIYGFDAVPMLVATNDIPQPDISYPTINNFNRTIACLYMDDKIVPLDGSLRYGDFPMVSKNVLQRWGFAMSMEHERWIYLEDNKSRDYDNTLLIGSITDKEELHFFVYVNSYEYAKSDRVKLLAEDSLKGFVKKYFVTPLAKPYRFIVANENYDTLPLAQEFEINIPMNEDLNLYKVNLPYSGIPAALLSIRPLRTSPLCFVVKQKYDFLTKIGVPNNFDTYVLPSAISLVYFNGDMTFKREIHKLDNSISIKYVFEINKLRFNEDEVPEFLKAMQKIKSLLDQEIVFKKRY
jgi:hypothetical protein